MKKRFFKCCVCVAILFCSYTTFAQQKNKAVSTTSTTAPKWIKMMDDPNVNFFEAQKNFNDYWKYKEKPEEENEMFKEEEEKSKNKKTKVRTTKSEEAQKYSFEYKKFLNWQREVAPYVQPDGRILNTEERIKLWEEEKRNREAAETNNKQ